MVFPMAERERALSWSNAVGVRYPSIVESRLTFWTILLDGGRVFHVETRESRLMKRIRDLKARSGCDFLPVP